ncbi:hybrid sensor histidine kinase/response regulator [Maribacter algicola]|uniref:histidine kinase n=1 Tax=Maribacter algicola TaxID=2498892 RepID=A0A426RI68_9FLAO|nr:hybrid sensor histidine kinase/response regulator [Maribacter algicola]
MLLLIQTTFKVQLLSKIGKIIRDSRPLVYQCYWVPLLFWFTTGHVLGQQQISFRNISVKDGLSQNSVVDITQDSLGYLWIATQDGLNRFDGQEFQHFAFQFEDITRPNYSNLGYLYTDKQGGLWVLPQDGKLRKYAPLHSQFNIYEELENAHTVYQDDNNTFWVGTDQGQIFKKHADSTRFENFEIDTNPISSRIRQFLQLEQDFLWVLTDHQCILFNTRTGKVQFELSSPKAENGTAVTFSKIVPKPESGLWVSTFGKGLYEIEHTLQSVSLERVTTFSVPEDLNILDMLLDSKDRLWIGTYGKGLFLVDGNAVRHFMPDKNDERTIHYKDILSIYEDYLGVLWFGTDGSGVSYYDEYLEKFNVVTNDQTPNDINVDVVRAITTDADGNFWIGTSGHGLTKYNPKLGQWASFTTQNSHLTSDRIMSLCYDGDNRLWIGTQEGGLWIMDANGELRKVTSVNANTIWVIFEDKWDRLWVGTQDQGLFQLDENGKVVSQYHTASEKHPLTSNNIRAIFNDSKGNLWVGTEDQGVMYLNFEEGQTEIINAVNDRPHLSTNAIKSVYLENDRWLWVGTNGKGIDVLDLKERTTKNYNLEKGLPNNVVYSLLPDRQNNIWISTNKGIAKLTPSKNHVEPPLVVPYDNYDGLATEFNTGAWHISKDHQLFFGGLEGFYWFDPATIKINLNLPKTQITQFSIFDQPTAMAEGTHLPYDQNTLSFSFSSMQFSLPEKNEYQYRLIDYDKDWIYSGNKNYARYPKLPPGNYTFQVKSSNYDRVWGPDIASFAFTIDPPWYWNSFSQIVYLILFALLLFTIYAYTKSRWRIQTDLKLQEAEADRLKKLHDFRSKLYMNIAHEFKTPLTLVSAPLEEMMADEGKRIKSSDNLSFVSRNLNRLTKLVDQLLQLGSLEEGKLKKMAIYGDITLFLRTLIASYQPQAKEANVAINSKIKQMPFSWYDEDMLEKTVGNLITNALKYAPKNTECTIFGTHEEGFLVLQVQNKISESIATEKLFERFYQENHEKEGMGIGLALVKELVDWFNGAISVKTNSDNISFLLKIDVRKNAFKDDERAEIAPFEKMADPNIGHEKNGEINKILLVEDDRETRNYISSVLEPEYQIIPAKNGMEGFDKAVKHLPDVIISDIKMPILDGIALCNQLKSDQRTSHIPLIMLTASSDASQELKALKVGADDYISKPFKTQILVQRIRNMAHMKVLWANRYKESYIVGPTDITVPPVEHQFLNKLQLILDKHLTDPSLSSPKLCELMGLSRMQLHRKLQSYTGLSTTAFLRSQRLKLATDLLKQGSLNVNEVAYMVGFNSPGYFMKCFKEQFQMTPTEFVASLNG